MADKKKTPAPVTKPKRPHPSSEKNFPQWLMDKPFNDPDGAKIPSKKEAKKSLEYAKGGKAKGGKCYAKGGSVSSRADGIAKKGRTNVKKVTMRKGGSC